MDEHEDGLVAAAQDVTRGALQDLADLELPVDLGQPAALVRRPARPLDGGRAAEGIAKTRSLARARVD